MIHNKSNLECFFHPLDFYFEESSDNNKTSGDGHWECCGYESFWNIGCKRSIHSMDSLGTSPTIEEDINKEPTIFLNKDMNKNETYLYLTFGNFLGLAYITQFKNISIILSKSKKLLSDTKIPILKQLVTESIRDYHIKTHLGVFDNKSFNENVSLTEDLNIAQLEKTLREINSLVEMNRKQNLINNCVGVIDLFEEIIDDKNDYQHIMRMLNSIDLFFGQTELWNNSKKEDIYFKNIFHHYELFIKKTLNNNIKQKMQDFSNHSNNENGNYKKINKRKMSNKTTSSEINLDEKLNEFVSYLGKIIKVKLE